MALDIALDNPDALSQRAVGIAPVIVKRLRRHSHSPCEDRHHSYCAHSPVPNGSGSSDCGVAAMVLCRSEARSVGAECGSTFRPRWSPYHSTKHNHNTRHTTT